MLCTVTNHISICPMLSTGHCMVVNLNFKLIVGQIPTPRKNSCVSANISFSVKFLSQTTCKTKQHNVIMQTNSDELLIQLMKNCPDVVEQNEAKTDQLQQWKNESKALVVLRFLFGMTFAAHWSHPMSSRSLPSTLGKIWLKLPNGDADRKFFVSFGNNWIFCRENASLPCQRSSDPFLVQKNRTFVQFVVTEHC